MAIGQGPEPKDEEFQSTPENSFFSPTKKRRKEKNEGDQDSALRCREEKKKKKDKKKSRHLRKKKTSCTAANEKLHKGPIRRAITNSTLDSAVHPSS